MIIRKIEETINQEIPKINSQLEQIENRIRPTLSLIFDDGLIENTRIVTLLKERGLICDFAIQGYWQSALDNRYFSNNNIQKWLKQGFGVLSHTMYHYDLRPENTSLSKAEYDIVKSKKVLKDLGYPINGFVAANSTINKKFDYLLDEYKYAFCGYYAPQSNFPIMNSKTNIKKLWRLGIDNTDISILKETIDNTIKENGFTCIYGHTLGTNFTEEKLIELLNYIKIKVDNKEIELLKCDDAITKVFGISMDYSVTNEAIENLATNLINYHTTAYRNNDQYKIESLKGNLPSISVDEVKNEMNLVFSNVVENDVFTIQYYFENTKDLTNYINQPISVRFNIEGNDIDFANISCEGRFFNSDGNETTNSISYTYMNKRGINDFLFYPNSSTYNTQIGVIIRFTFTQAKSSINMKFSDFAIGYGTSIKSNLQNKKGSNEIIEDKFLIELSPDNINGDSKFYQLNFSKKLSGFTGSMADIENNSIIAIKEGYININTTLSISDGVQGKRFIIRYFKNGVQYSQNSFAISNNGHNGFSHQTIVKVNKNDKITVSIFHDTGATCLLSNGYCFINGYYI